MYYVIIYWRSRDCCNITFYCNIFWFKKIPELAKGLGKAIREVKDASNDIKKEIRDSASSIEDDFDVNK